MINCTHLEKILSIRFFGDKAKDIHLFDGLSPQDDEHAEQEREDDDYDDDVTWTLHTFNYLISRSLCAESQAQKKEKSNPNHP